MSIAIMAIASANKKDIIIASNILGDADGFRPTALTAA